MEPKRQKGESPESTPGQGGMKKWFREFMDLREGSDREGAVDTIASGRLMRGSNAWMLVCSIMIASLGLNLNSGAVIIGAMLISPLMNPILGIGLGVGTNDRDMLWVALKNFGVAIAIALITSSIYFLFTPLDIFTPEMRARTEPTLLDGLIAVFGGLAGIISVTRADKTNAIPGVAIATALMPPLCVAGYGFTMGVKTIGSESGMDFEIFWRAFYLFFLNSFFIAATAYLIIRILRFPYRKYMNAQESRRSQIVIGVISVFMVLPGYFILNDVLQRQRDNKAVERFTNQYFPASASSSIFDRRNPQEPLLIYPFTHRQVSPDSIVIYSQMLQQPPFNVTGARVVVDTSFSPGEIAGIKGELASIDEMNGRLRVLEEAHIAEVRARSDMLNEISGYRMDSADFLTFSRQLMIAFPKVDQVRLARSQSSQLYGPDDEAPYIEDLPLVIVRELPNRLTTSEVERMNEYLKLQLALDTLVLIRERR